MTDEMKPPEVEGTVAPAAPPVPCIKISTTKLSGVGVMVELEIPVQNIEAALTAAMCGDPNPINTMAQMIATARITKLAISFDQPLPLAQAVPNPPGSLSEAASGMQAMLNDPLQLARMLREGPGRPGAPPFRGRGK